MSMEYAVQTLNNRTREWNHRAVHTDLNKAKNALSMMDEVYPENIHRLACREVGDWCECREAK